MDQMLLERILSLCQRGRLNWDDCNIKKSSQFPFPAPPQFIEPSSWTPKQPSRRVACSSAAAWNLGRARGSNQSKVVWAPAAAGMRGETHHIESICRIYWAQSVLSPLSLTHIRQMIKSSTPCVAGHSPKIHFSSHAGMRLEAVSMEIYSRKSRET